MKIKIYDYNFLIKVSVLSRNIDYSLFGAGFRFRGESYRMVVPSRGRKSAWRGSGLSLLSSGRGGRSGPRAGA